MPPASRDPSRPRVAQLNRRASHAVELRPDPQARATLAADLELIELPALSLTGTLSPEGGEGWRFAGRLTADVVQPCVVTLAPVPAHIDEAVSRAWSPHVAAPEGGGEVEMTDDELEPLGQTIDLAALMAEELSLALPPYPRAPGVSLDETAEEDGTDEDEPRRPFAGLDQLLRGRDGEN